MDAALAASSCQAVTDAIRDIYAQDMEKLNFEQLYRFFSINSCILLKP